MTRTILIWCFTTLAICASAQRDTLSFRERYLPTGIRVGTDALAIIRSRTNPNFTGWEVNADVDMYRYYITADYGTWSRAKPGDSVNYVNDGKYWRVGTDINFLLKDEERNMFFVGFRYGHSTFNETMRVLDTDSIWGTLDRYSNPFVNTNVQAHWLELTTGLKVKMLSWFWMGYTARFKFALNTGSTPEMLPYDIPGYGSTHKETTWGFNYQLMFRIPLRAYPPLPAPKKKKKTPPPDDSNNRQDIKG